MHGKLYRRNVFSFPPPTVNLELTVYNNSIAQTLVSLRGFSGVGGFRCGMGTNTAVNYNSLFAANLSINVECIFFTCGSHNNTWGNCTLRAVSFEVLWFFLQLSLSRVISHNTKKISWRAPSCNRFGQHGSWENFCPLHLQQKSPFWWPVCRLRRKLHGFYNLNFMICGWKWDNII